MKTLPFIPISTLILFTACATHHKSDVSVHPVVIPDTMLSKHSVKGIRYAENIKMYPVGRYIDPNNPNIMHEGHPIYRIESTAKWNLHPNPPANIPIGPVLKIRDSAKTTLQTEELTAELARQKETTRTVIQGSAALSKKLADIAKTLSQTKQVAEQNAQVKKAVFDTQSRLDLLETEIRHSSSDSSHSTTPATPKPSAAGASSDW